MKNIRIRILNQHGDNSFVQELGEAIQTVINARFGQGQWPYVDSTIFQFTAESADSPEILADAQRLREILLEAPEGVTVTLAGDLAGGTTETPEKQVTLRILNEHGDESTLEGLGVAVARVIEERLKNKRWAYVNSNIFQFDEEALHDPVRLVQETARLHDYVNSIDGPVQIMLTGDLAGGTL